MTSELLLRTGGRHGTVRIASRSDALTSINPDTAKGRLIHRLALPPGRAGLEEFLREYLSPQHRDNPGDDCPSAALLDEIGRCETAAKDAYTGGARSIVDEIAARLAPGDPQSARGNTLGLFTMAVGTLQLSRAVSDPALADEVLEQGIRNARAFLP